MPTHITVLSVSAIPVDVTVTVPAATRKTLQNGVETESAVSCENTKPVRFSLMYEITPSVVSVNPASVIVLLLNLSNSPFTDAEYVTPSVVPPYMVPGV